MAAHRFHDHLTRRRALHVGLAAAVLALAAACASTVIEHSWAKPDIGPLNFRKVVTFGLTRDPARRRLFEESMATQIQKVAPDVQAIPSYTLVSDGDLANEGQVRDQVNHAGFDGAVFMRVTDVTRQDVWVPGGGSFAPEYYRTFWGYYRHWAPIAYGPSYVERDANVQVETEVYSTGGEGDLVYAAMSRTLNPGSASDLVHDVASVVASDMKDKGLLRNDR